jgi:hypothetical protein
VIFSKVWTKPGKSVLVLLKKGKKTDRCKIDKEGVPVWRWLPLEWEWDRVCAVIQMIEVRALLHLEHVQLGTE